jgi:hypothetical protein
MSSCRAKFISAFALVTLALCTPVLAQSPSALYTWNGSGNPQDWVKNFGTNTVTLSNTTPGVLTIAENGAAGADVAISDGANRVRESTTAASGGTDVTGLDFMEFDLGHNGSAPINVQFFVQGSTGFSYVALGPDIAVTPGLNTYQVPLTSLTADQAVYLRTMGFNARAHAAVGNVTWTLGEVRAGGTPLTTRTLITHDTGTAEGGLQGALVNFDGAAVQGNTGQNQTGLSHNPAGSGSLRWTDLGGSAGGAISWGNGTALNGNTFNNRTTDLSNYDTMTIRISADDPANGGGTLGFNAFFQKNGFNFANPEGGAARNIIIDGGFQEFTFSLAGLTDMNVIEQTGINLFAHPQNLIIDVDSIRFDVVPEPTSAAVLGAAAGLLGLSRRRGRTHAA